jgi:hypothetical protein
VKPLEEQDADRRPVVPFNRWHAPIIASVVASYSRAVYVEIGVFRGDCLATVAPVAGQAHGVDATFEKLECDVSAARLWEMTSDEFFRAYDGPPADVVFVDGDHAYEQARRDIHNALGWLADGGCLFLHDTWPVFAGATDRMTCGEVYRVADELREDPALEVATIRRWPGLSLVTRRQPALMSQRSPRRARRLDTDRSVEPRSA